MGCSSTCTVDTGQGASACVVGVKSVFRWCLVHQMYAVIMILATNCKSVMFLLKYGLQDSLSSLTFLLYPVANAINK